jgi:hypothetical protein
MLTELIVAHALLAPGAAPSLTFGPTPGSEVAAVRAHETDEAALGAMASGPLTLIPATAAQVDRARAPAAYGPRMGNWSFTLGGVGLADRRLSSSTWGVNFSIGHFVIDALEISFRQSINFTDVGGSNLQASSRGAVDWHFDLGQFWPYVGLHGGYFYGDRDDTWMVGPEVGLKYFVKPETYLFGQMEYQHFIKSVRDITDRRRHGQFVFTLGVGFLW